MAAQNYWLVRAGPASELASEFYAKQVVAVGWPDVGDISDVTAADELKGRYLQQNPQEGNLRAGQIAAQLFMFASSIEVGDVVLVPVQSREVHVGEVDGPYLFDPNIISPLTPHVRRVRWVRSVSYRSLSVGLRRSIETPRTVQNLNNWAREIQRIYEGVEAPTTRRPYGLPRNQLTQIRFERFKSFSERTEISIDPITVIAGVNSGGKSSIIQSLLLMRQTLITPYRATLDDALEYDGELVRFASFREVIFGKPATSKGGVRFGFSVSVSGPVFPGLVRSLLPEEIQEQDIRSILVEIDIKFGFDQAQKVSVVEVIDLSARLTTPGGIVPGPTMRIRPESRNRAAIAYALGRQVIEEGSRYVSLRRFIPTFRTFEREQRELARLFDAFFGPAFRALQVELEERLVYVGPLRSAPQRPYLRRSIVGLDMGPAGENAVQLLHENWDREVDFISLPVTSMGGDYSNLQPSRVKLKDAVHSSLRLLGMEQQLRIEKQGESFEASLSLLSKPSTYVAITEVGFGVSQVLPIIAAGLLSTIDSIVIFEQPEIHLHPRAQAGLAEFILGLAKTGRRIVIETHSDHLMNRLRRKAAEDASDTLGNQVSILFVNPPSSDGDGATVTKATVNRYGEIDNWPPGFLAETAQDARAILLAGSGKRMKERDSKGARDGTK